MAEHLIPVRVQSLIRRLRTPEQVQKWLYALKYNPTDTMRTLPEVVKHKSAHCLEASLCAAAILEHHGHPPIILDLESADLLDHTLFLFRRHGLYGSVGLSRDIGLSGRLPVFKTIHALVKSYIIPYIDAKAEIKKYGTLDLRTLPRGHWRSSPRSVWYIEEALRKVPHHPVKTSPALVRAWRKKFIDFKTKYPRRQPDFFPDQYNWM